MPGIGPLCRTVVWLRVGREKRGGRERVVEREWVVGMVGDGRGLWLVVAVVGWQLGLVCGVGYGEWCILLGRVVVVTRLQ